MSKLIGIRCNDMRQRKESDGENKLFGGYQSYALLVQAQACVKCEKAIWDVDMDGRKEVGKVAEAKGMRVHVALQDSGEILSYVVGRGFE